MPVAAVRSAATPPQLSPSPDSRSAGPSPPVEPSESQLARPGLARPAEADVGRESAAGGLRASDGACAVGSRVRLC